MEVLGIFVRDKIMVELQDMNYKLCAGGEEVHVHGRV